MQMFQRLGPDVTPEKAPVEPDLLYRVIRALNGLFDRFSQTCYPQHTPTRGDDLAVFLFRAGVKNDRMVVPDRIESLDLFSRCTLTRITSGGHHNADTATLVPVHLDFLQVPFTAR